MLSATHATHLLALTALLAAGADAAEEGVSAERAQAIAAMLPERPAGVGPPCSDRAAWERLARTPSGPQIVARAEGILARPLPEQPDDLYLEFSRTGNRTHWQDVAFERRGRLSWLVLAECLENKGRFVPAIEALVAALSAERTWVLPAHDAGLTNFNGTSVDIDLASSGLGWELALTHHLLGNKLSPATRKRIRDEVGRRVLGPFRAMATGARPRNWWMDTTNNWNAVCLAGVTGAGLALIESRQERGWLVAAAEKYSRNFLAGFTPDGYCSEGLGYWSYGFGHYVLLSETVRRATRGGVDLLARPEARMPAAFAARIQILGGVAPAFADCSVDAQPGRAIMHLLNRRFGLGLQEYDRHDPGSGLGSLSSAMIYAFPDEGQPAAPAAADDLRGTGLRTWFDHAGILIGRPAPGSACRLGVALKGGHNDEHHNHNDVGSYVVVVGKRAVLLDPGAEVYTARTFSSRRYESKLLNSYGHPVPVVAGQLQRTGRAARAQVLRTDFTDAADTLELDIQSAYSVPDLQELRRTFIYSREGAGSLTITDRVSLKNPQTFETALITRGEWKRLGDARILIQDAGEAVSVTVDTQGKPFDVVEDTIREDAPVKPTRLAIRLREPVTEATVSLRVIPTDER